ncbi:DUF2378 family protein [Vitiosangium sp. GDMCC 1.1324]|uniref:DUF2378 family protein n=1 Tax=Vitiosangium sp. (strain GDMCC 1.1324) TaxID=2138576 RepID=UPI00130DF6B0|nr:DUF2378 family protein [Vitiosangium sp. GDMCC 1.1324]
MEQHTHSAWSTSHHAIRREPVVFGHALEHLLADVELLQPRAQEALAGLGLSLHEPLHAAYPGAVWVGAIHVLSDALYPHLSPSRAHVALGRRFMEKTLQSRLGAAMNAHARAIGPERMLSRLSHQFRMMNNFLGVSVHERPAHAGWELVIRPLPEFLLLPGVHGEPPHFTRGALTTAFQAAGVSGVRMNLVDHDATLGASVFHVTF